MLAKFQTHHIKNCKINGLTV